MGNHNFGENLMPDPTDKRIEELWQYIPPYTAPNHPPQVKVITTTNTGDTPMTEEDPDLLAGKNLDGLRARNPYHPMSERFRLTELLETANYQNNLLAQKCRELEKERDEARWEVCGFHHLTGFLAGDYAISRGWNYFNDERKWAKFPQSVTDFDKFLKARSEENNKSIERLWEENRQLRELKMQGVVSEPVKATPPHYDNLQDLG